MLNIITGVITGLGLGISLGVAYEHHHAISLIVHYCSR